MEKKERQTECEHDKNQNEPLPSLLVTAFGFFSHVTTCWELITGLIKQKIPNRQELKWNSTFKISSVSGRSAEVRALRTANEYRLKGLVMYGCVTCRVIWICAHRWHTFTP